MNPHRSRSRQKSDRFAKVRRRRLCGPLCRAIACAGLLSLLTANPASAQKAPELGYVFPPAIRAGAATDVRLGGYDFTPDMQFFVHDDRVALEVLGPLGDFIIPKPPYWFGEKGRSSAFPIPREIPARIVVPSDCAPGWVRWQVANANGSSATAVFYVSHGLEALEDRYRDEPQSLHELPVGVSGRLERIAEVDRYQIQGKRDGPITVELFARRHGANFNGVLEIRNARGQLIADAADTEGLDTALTFAAKVNETYTVSLHDVDFRGNRAFVYRLAITPGPRVITTIPAVGQRGESCEVEFVGYGVSSGAAKLESTTRTITFPADPLRDVLRYQLETPHGIASPIEIPLGDLRNIRLAARDHDEGNPVNLDAPCAVTSTLGASGSPAYTWNAKKGEAWSISAQSRSIGTDLDLSLSIRDASGKQLATNDDLPGTPDAGLQFKVPADGTYTCIVSDLSGRCGQRSSVYRLTLERRESTFSLSVPQQVSFPVPGKSQLQVKATRYGGHTGEIALEVRGLPEGVTVPNDLKIPAGKNEVKIPLEAARDAASQAALIQVIGSAKVGEESVTRVATSSAAGNLCPRDDRQKQASQVLLATTLQPQYSVELIDKNRQRAVHRGTTYPAPFIIKRDEGFDGDVILQMAARQGRHRQGIRAPRITVPAGTSEALYPCFMPEWLETDRTTRMVVLGVAKQADPQGNLRYVTKTANARITMILEGALLKVSHRAGELTISAGDEFQIPIEIARSTKLPKSVSIELVIPDELVGLVQSVPAITTLAPNQNKAALKIQTVPDSRLVGRWKLHVKATALQNGKWPTVSQTEVTVQFE